MTTPYDPSFDPPALTLTVTLTGLVHLRPRLQLPGLIDTGSDMTAIPDTAIKRLRLYTVGQMQIEDVHATILLTDLYAVRLTIPNQPTRELEVVPTKQPFVALGRDWLADYYLYLSGPAQTFQLSTTPLLPE